MKPILLRLTSAFGWNERVFTQDDFDDFCGLYGIVVEYRDAGFPGMYTVRRKTPIIVVSPYVLPRARSFVKFHELGHHWMHNVGCHFTYNSRRRIEREADLIAACALIPRPLLESATPGEIHDEYRYPMELCYLRQQFYADLKI